MHRLEAQRFEDEHVERALNDVGILGVHETTMTTFLLIVKIWRSIGSTVACHPEERTVSTSHSDVSETPQRVTNASETPPAGHPDASEASVGSLSPSAVQQPWRESDHS